jgi:hypothetical protein
MKIKDIKNQKYGRLLVIEYAGKGKNRRALWKCKCDCGKEIVACGHCLRNGNTKSCGCFGKSQTSKARTKHHMTGTKIYYVWQAIKKRCLNPKDKEYHRYGGRGIKICDEWEHDFSAFYAFISKLPHFGEEGYSIDRINNDGNYEPCNVKMSTWKEQAQNRSNKSRKR